jgi:hypothetical protein
MLMRRGRLEGVGCRLRAVWPISGAVLRKVQQAFAVEIQVHQREAGA